MFQEFHIVTHIISPIYKGTTCSSLMFMFIVYFLIWLYSSPCVCKKAFNECLPCLIRFALRHSFSLHLHLQNCFFKKRKHNAFHIFHLVKSNPICMAYCSNIVLSRDVPCQIIRFFFSFSSFSSHRISLQFPP